MYLLYPVCIIRRSRVFGISLLKPCHFRILQPIPDPEKTTTPEMIEELLKEVLISYQGQGNEEDTSEVYVDDIVMQKDYIPFLLQNSEEDTASDEDTNPGLF